MHTENTTSSITGTLNCLQCRKCSLEVTTEMSDPRPTIHCGNVIELRDNKGNPTGGTVTVGRREINLIGCPSAEAESRRRQGVPWTDVARQFVRTHYPDGEWHVLLLTGRSRAAIHCMAKELGISGTRVHRRSDGGHMNLGHRKTWTQAQDDFLRQSNGTDNWPTPGNPEVRDRENKARIVETINALGPPHSWRRILDRASILRPGQAARAERIRNRQTRNYSALRARRKAQAAA